jgi:3-methyladenine DNA glycosylase AlkD
VALAARTEADALSAGLRALASEPVDPSPVIRTTLPFYGASLADMDHLAGAWHRAHPDCPPRVVLAVADELWGRAVREEMVLATMLVGRRPALREAFGVRRLDRWGTLLDNWETTDNLGGRVLGPWIAADPGLRLAVLERLATRRNPWLRRLSLVACVQVGRRPDAAAWWPRVGRLVLGLAGERRAAIPKAVSWVLREHTRHCPEAVAAFLEEHGRELPAIAVRETRRKLATGYKQAPRPARPVGG